MKKYDILAYEYRFEAQPFARFAAKQSKIKERGCGGNSFPPPLASPLSRAYKPPPRPCVGAHNWGTRETEVG